MKTLKLENCNCIISAIDSKTNIEIVIREEFVELSDIEKFFHLVECGNFALPDAYGEYRYCDLPKELKDHILLLKDKYVFVKEKFQKPNLDGIYEVKESSEEKLMLINGQFLLELPSEYSKSFCISKRNKEIIIID